ncbi:hypothetical protein MJG53_011144 [Ovis ammon polii x Ovis aries]|uniref:Uncharacterized protein n=1 Tax=Ovis ammon polii x Ovis aries TaxID=2918886 RepID=A0ACB9URX9_9CETA|nr:hypothetical protein MJG53_011144 [Ovis ammon polii x Ovis aries]
MKAVNAELTAIALCRVDVGVGGLRQAPTAPSTRCAVLPCAPPPVLCLYGCYVHSSIIPTFHRRCYWLLQVVKILPSNAGGTDLIPGRGTKIPHAEE